MSDPFFQKKRKRGAETRKRAAPARKEHDESDGEDAMGAFDDMDLTHRFDDASDDDGAAAAETPAEAKVRLARLYLEGLRDKEEDVDVVDGADAAAADRENIAARLQKDVQEAGGRVHVFVAQRLRAPAADEVLALHGHRLAVTVARTSARSPYLFSADKQGRIVQWRLRDGCQVCVVPRRAAHAGDVHAASRTSGAARRRERERRPGSAFQGTLALGENEGHSAEVYALAVSDDGAHLVSGGRDRRIGVWRVGEAGTPLRWVRALTGHKDAIRGLAFRGETLELFSASLDRTVKLFDVSQLSYIETLFGHQEAIEDLSCLRAERAVTAGGRERTCRLWKIREESQLVFRGGTRSKVQALLEGGDLIDTHDKNEVHEGSLDCVAMIDDHHFVSGSDAGTLSLWSIAKKKPLFSLPAAHGFDVRTSETEGVQRRARYITSVAALPYGDVFASGSWDGEIRVWALDAALQRFAPLFTIPAHGVVNSLQLVTPTVERAEDYPVHPGRWRRRGGLGAPLAAPDASHGSGLPPMADRFAAVQRDPATGRVLGHKECIPPLLIAGIGQERKADRYFTLPDAVPGTLVVPLWLS